jgi:hypothetical protein
MHLCSLALDGIVPGINCAQKKFQLSSTIAPVQVGKQNRHNYRVKRLSRSRFRAGDELDIGYADGLIVLRKRRALTPARVRSLILGRNELPEMRARDETAVSRAIQRVRHRRK